MDINHIIDLTTVIIALWLFALVGFFLTRSQGSPRRRLLETTGDARNNAESRILNAVYWLARLPVPHSITLRLGEISAAEKLMAADNPAGLTGKNAGRDYVRLKLALEVLTALIFLFMGLTSFLPPLGALVMSALAAAAIWALPDWYLSQLHTRRVDAINNATPDLVDLLVVSVEGGQTLYRALQLVSKRFPDPLGAELRLAMREISMGAELDVALREVAERTEAEEFRRFITPFIQAYSQGAKSAENMRALSEDMRERRKQRAQEQGRRAATFVLLPMMACIFPALLITVVGPAMMGFFASISGR